MSKILIVGCGKIGTKLALLFLEQHHEVSVLKRNPPDDCLTACHWIQADITNAQNLTALEENFDQVFFIVSPDVRNEEAYFAIYNTGLNNIVQQISQQTVSPHLFFVSSTSVYGQNNGEWVDESSITLPETTTGQLISNAEQYLLLTTSLNFTIVRLSGIYGIGREWLVKKTQQVPEIQKEPPYYTNRVHELDCIAVLHFLSEQQFKGVSLQQIYLVSDDDPAPQWEVVCWLADKLKLTRPGEKPVNEMTAMNKRCRNTRIKQLGYNFMYPSYRDGYCDILQNR